MRTKLLHTKLKSFANFCEISLPVLLLKLGVIFVGVVIAAIISANKETEKEKEKEKSSNIEYVEW